MTACSLRALLEKEGISVLLDEDDFVAGRDLKVQMAEAVEKTKLTVCLLSPGYFDRPESTMYELDRAARANKCFPILSGINHGQAKLALGLDIHGLAGLLAHTLNPYQLQKTVAEIVRHLKSQVDKPDPPVESKKETRTYSFKGSAPVHLDSAEQLVIVGSVEVSELLTTSAANPTATTKAGHGVIHAGQDLLAAGTFKFAQT